MDDVKGKVTVITDAGRGTARGIAIAYGRAGLKVVVTSRSKSTIDPVVDEIKKDGGTAVGITCDVGHRDQVFSMIDQAVKTYGTIDVLVNSAQSFGPAKAPTQFIHRRPLEECDEDEWENTYRTGVMGTLWAMKAAFPHLKKKGGKIINFGSSGGQFGLEGQAAYNSTKEALRGLTRTAAREWGKYGINVNIINPMTASEAQIAWETADPTEANKVREVTPMRRFGDVVKDGGGLAIFLASSSSDYLTGMTFMLDGGFFMYP